MTTNEPPAEAPPAANRRTFLSLSTAAAVTATAGAGVALTAAPADARERGWPDGPGKPVRDQPPDAELRRLLREIDRDRIEANVRKLVGFGTRHTLSSQDEPDRGIGAARDWMLAE